MGPGLFDPRGSMWSLLLNLLDKGPVGAVEARLFYTRQSHPLIEIIFSKQAS